MRNAAIDGIRQAERLESTAATAAIAIALFTTTLLLVAVVVAVVFIRHGLDLYVRCKPLLCKEKKFWTWSVGTIFLCGGCWSKDL